MYEIIENMAARALAQGKVDYFAKRLEKFAPKFNLMNKEKVA